MPPQTCAGVTETEVKRPNTSDLTADGDPFGIADTVGKDLQNC
jgi:hypothetical protein